MIELRVVRRPTRPRGVGRVRPPSSRTSHVDHRAASQRTARAADAARAARRASSRERASPRDRTSAARSCSARPAGASAPGRGRELVARSPITRRGARSRRRTAAHVEEPGALAFAELFGFSETDHQVEQVRSIGPTRPPRRRSRGSTSSRSRAAADLARPAVRSRSQGYEDLQLRAAVPIQFDDLDARGGDARRTGRSSRSRTARSSASRGSM